MVCSLQTIKSEGDYEKKTVQILENINLTWSPTRGECKLNAILSLQKEDFKLIRAPSMEKFWLDGSLILDDFKLKRAADLEDFKLNSAPILGHCMLYLTDILEILGLIRL